MDRYYVPAQFNLTDPNLYSFFWNTDRFSYRVLDGCPNRETGGAMNYVDVSPWGYVVDSGSFSVAPTDFLIVSESCDPSEYDIGTGFASRSILDAPNFAPYEPFYFVMFLILSVWLLSSAFKLLFGRAFRC